MTSITTKLIVGAVSGVLLAGLGTVLWRHYSGLVDAKAELSAKVTGLEADVSREKSRAEALELTIDRWDSAAGVQAKALDDLTRAQREAATVQRELKDVLSSHDLGKLAAAKPELVERRVNTGTDRAFRLLERSSEAAAPAPVQGASSSSPARPGRD